MKCDLVPFLYENFLADRFSFISELLWEMADLMVRVKHVAELIDGEFAHDWS